MMVSNEQLQRAALFKQQTEELIQERVDAQAEREAVFEMWRNPWDTSIRLVAHHIRAIAFFTVPEGTVGIRPSRVREETRRQRALSEVRYARVVTADDRYGSNAPCRAPLNIVMRHHPSQLPQKRPQQYMVDSDSNEGPLPHDTDDHAKQQRHESNGGFGQEPKGWGAFGEKTTK
jgi:hypothetical protein